MENAAECGSTWRGWLVKLSPDGYSWKTPQCSLFEDLEQSLETWPRWGLMQHGECSELLTLAPRTDVNESGLWPTPRVAQAATEGPNGSGGGLYLKGALRLAEAGLWPMNYRDGKWKARELDGGNPNPEWVEWLMGWPVGWADLKPLETAKFQEWQRLHSPSWPNN